MSSAAGTEVVVAKELLLGVYTISPSRTGGGKRVYLIEGWTEAGERIRQRKDTEDEAKKVVEVLAEADGKNREARRLSGTAITEKRYVFSSEIITSKARRDDIEAALRLFPTNEAGIPDPLWSLRDCVERGIKAGYNPTFPDVTVADVAPTYREYYKWRNTLAPTDANYVGPKTLEAFYPRLNRLVKLFGTLKFSALAAEGELKKRILNSGLRPSVADKIASTFNGMAAWGTEENLNPKDEKASAQVGDLAAGSAEADTGGTGHKPAPVHHDSGPSLAVADRIAGTFNGMAASGAKENLNSNDEKARAQVGEFAAGTAETDADGTGHKPAPEHPRYLARYTPWSCPYKVKGIPQVYSRAEYQALLDEAWRQTVSPVRRASVSRAATIIMRIWCALRPSETDHPEFHVNEDCSVAHVPEGTKSGFRLVAIPPCAQIQLRLLKARGLLSFAEVTPQAMAVFRGKAGFPLCSSAMRGAFANHTGRKYKTVTAEEAEKWFRGNWPLRFGKRKQDVDRHTGGSAYANASRNLPATSKWMGNGLDDLDHYIGLFPQVEIPSFYQTVATPLQGIIRPKDIPLPSWFDAQGEAAYRAEQVAVGDLVTTLISHSDELISEASEPDDDAAALKTSEESVEETVAA